MNKEKYIKCKYCSGIYNYNNNHVFNCNKQEYCYSCGEKNKNYSNSQLTKENKARCTDCVLNKNIHKFAPYLHLYEKSCRVDLMHINAQLIYYVWNLNLQQINKLLQQNANPNYNRQDIFFDNNEYKYLYWYNEDGTEKMEDDDDQPTNPLKLCVFMLSNCLFTTKEKHIIIKIAELLIEYGANTEDAIAFFERRYGIVVKNDDNFNTFYKLLKNVN